MHTTNYVAKQRWLPGDSWLRGPRPFSAIVYPQCATSIIVCMYVARVKIVA